MIVFGSRGSELALTQTRQVASELEHRTGEPFRVEVIETSGDRELAKPLPEIGGKGLFTAELEDALRRGAIDVAVHSLKDLPVEDVEGLALGAIPPRVSYQDVLVCGADAVDETRGVIPLREGARVGTSSLRRAGALRSEREDLECTSVRGNVPTRVDKVRRGDYDAVVLAAAGLDRLGLDLGELLRVPLPAELCPPAPGQGALGVQCRRDDARNTGLLAKLHDEMTARCVAAERGLLAALGGGCSMPLGALATAQPDGGYSLQAALFARSGGVGGVYRTAAGGDLDALVAKVAAELAPLVAEPLAGARVDLLRPRGADDELDRYVAVAGANLRRVEPTAIEPIEVRRDELERCMSGALAFTSPRSVERFFAEAARHGVPLAPTSRVFAVGERTAAALAAHGVHAEHPAPAAGGERLAEHVLASDLDPRVGIGFPCAEQCHPALARHLGEAGREVYSLPVYRTVIRSDAAAGELAPVVVVCAPSCARALEDELARQSPRLIAIGETTANQLRELELPVGAIASEPTPRAVMAAIWR